MDTELGSVSVRMGVSLLMVNITLVSTIGKDIPSLRTSLDLSQGDVMVIIDDREINQHPEIADLLGISFSVQRLDAGDFCFLDVNNEVVGIERCTVNNFVQKLMDGQLESQMYKCQEQFSSVILLIEGVCDSHKDLLALYKKGNNAYFRYMVYPRLMYKSILAAIVSLSNMGVEIITTANFECTMEAIRLIYASRTRTEHTLFKKTRKIRLPVKSSANPSVPRLMAIVPRLSEKAAVRLMYKFDTIWNVLHAEDKELMEIEGVGRGVVRRIKEAVGKP